MKFKRIIFKISAILFLTNSIAYGGFEVEPLGVSINLERGFARLNIKNKDQQKKFFLELRETTTKKITNDLSYSPSSFLLKPNQTQTIRIATRSGINYGRKSYYLNIKTANETGLVANQIIGVKIPISINGNLNNDTTVNENSPSQENGGLTQIKVVIPVTATVE